MTDLPPPSLTQAPPVNAELPAAPQIVQRAHSTLVIDLMPPAPPPQACAAEVPDPFNAEIVVCQETVPSPRLGPSIGPQDDGFASLIPRARIKLSDKAAAEANGINYGVGGFNANGGEVRLKIDF